MYIAALLSGVFIVFSGLLVLGGSPRFRIVGISGTGGYFFLRFSFLMMMYHFRASVLSAMALAVMVAISAMVFSMLSPPFCLYTHYNAT